jgi:dTDP-4-dehydrorhamnose reductase
MIGAALASHFAAHGWQVQATTRRRDSVDASHPYLDLRAPSLDLPGADIVVLAAAVARIGDCEADPAGTLAINVTGTHAVARHMAAQGAHVLLLSSDKVFDGATPMRGRHDEPCPACVYGQQKAAAEAGVIALGDQGAVLRLSKVLEPGQELLTGWARDLGQGKPITPFDDLYLAPVSLELVARTVTHIADECAAGIFHCTGAEDRPYMDLARILAEKIGYDPALIQATSCHAANMPAAARPRHTTLEMTVEQARWGLCAPEFEATAREIIDHLGNR